MRLRTAIVTYVSTFDMWSDLSILPSGTLPARKTESRSSSRLTWSSTSYTAESSSCVCVADFFLIGEKGGGLFVNDCLHSLSVWCRSNKHPNDERKNPKKRSFED